MENIVPILIALVAGLGAGWGVFQYFKADSSKKDSQEYGVKTTFISRFTDRDTLEQYAKYYNRSVEDLQDHLAVRGPQCVPILNKD